MRPIGVSARTPRRAWTDKDPQGKPGTFDFLGFKLYWGRAGSGTHIPKPKTAKKRLTRALKALRDWGWEHRHFPLREQRHKLNEKLRGHDAYYGVRHNAKMLSRLRWELHKPWRRWLNRRNHRGGLNWKDYHNLIGNYPLAPARVVHSVM